MTPSRLAVIFSVTLCLLLLPSHASLEAVDPSTAVAVTTTPSEVKVNAAGDDAQTAVLSLDESSIPTVDLSRQIAHSFRLPLGPHHHLRHHLGRLIRLRRGCHGRHGRRPIGGDVRTMEIPYGNDMIVGSHGGRREVPAIKRGWGQIANPTVDWEEIQRKRMKKMRKMKKEKKEDESDTDSSEDESDTDSSDDEEEEIKYQRKKMMKRMRKMKREAGGFLGWFRRFLNRF